MKAQILTLYSDCTTVDVCKNLAHTMEELKGRCYIQVVNKETSIMYCAVIANQKISPLEASIIYHALDMARLYEREKPFLDESVIDTIESTYEDIHRQLAYNKINRLPKLSLWMEELLDTYL